MLEMYIMGKTHQETMQHAQFIGLRLGNVMQCRCYQHWYLHLQALPTARALSVLLGYIAHFKRPAGPQGQQHEHHGAFLGPNFLLDSPSKNLGVLRCPKMRNEGPMSR